LRKLPKWQWIKVVEIPAPSKKEQARAAYITGELKKLALVDIRTDDLSNVLRGPGIGDDTSNLVAQLEMPRASSRASSTCFRWRWQWDSETPRILCQPRHDRSPLPGLRHDQSGVPEVLRHVRRGDPHIRL